MDALLGPEMEKMSKIYAKINAAARRAPPSGKEPIRDQVHARLALATLGTEMAAITSALSGIFPSAPLLNPPIATGMVDTVEKIHGTLMKHGAISQAEMKEMSACFERLRHLLRVYYDAKLSGRKTMEFRFCDMKDVNTIGLKLHEVGVFLQLSPERLRAFLDASPSIESWLLDAPLDIGKWRRETEAAQRAVKEDPEADDDDRMRVSDMDQKSQADCTAYQLAFFVGDILVALLLNPAHDERDQERADKAMTRLVEMSTKPVYRNTYGDPLTDAMRPVYWTPKLLVRFSHAGGLPALVGDWVGRICLCSKRLVLTPVRL
ncbi:hypothetical protein PLICRDRAFT_467216 [Plicaturopsis crispa FD-325 SS-3]|nr:hypothetical protein PLICRDRAFT_467216 [Plicaturopsis crispa FD-325 SS-3]